MKSIFKPRDPWHGRYLHHSGKFELILDHFDDDATTAELFDLPRLKNEQSRALFIAQIKNDKAIYQSRRETDCRIELQAVDKGIILSDFCHGTGEDVGLYRMVE